MRIGVLTHSASDDNYGQLLQCYALQEYLKKIGHQPFLIHYEVENTPKKDILSPLKIVVRTILNLISKKHRDAYRGVKTMKMQREINAVRNKKRMFEQFKSKNIEQTRFYGTYSELLINPPQADVYIVGSDQVWIPMVNSYSSLAWYLQFGSKEIKRIAYAASFGRQLNESEYEKFRTLTAIFSAISVRENKAQIYCKNAGVENVNVVLDPTCLVGMEVYMPFIQMNKTEKPYLFLYYVNVINKDDLSWNQIESFINAKGLELKSVSASGYYPSFDIIPNHENLLLTIPEWINCVYHANYVITTSFHGVVFAILMHRPFVSIPIKGMYSGGNDRVVSFLENFDLSDRILADSRTINDILISPIDWTPVDTRLKELRKGSEDFLIKALNYRIIKNG